MIWKILSGLTRDLFWIVLAWMIYSVTFDRRCARVINEGRIEFAPHWLTIWAWLFITGFMAWRATRNFMHGHGNPWEVMILACLGLAALGILFDNPATIVVTGDGLEQLYWFRRKKRIRWSEFEEVKTGKKSGMVTVTGKDGTKIIHSPMLADRQRFLLELKRHCGEELPPDFPREPIDGL